MTINHAKWRYETDLYTRKYPYNVMIKLEQYTDIVMRGLLHDKISASS